MYNGLINYENYKQNNYQFKEMYSIIYTYIYKKNKT